MKMENQNERNGECVKPFDFLAQDKEKAFRKFGGFR